MAQKSEPWPAGRTIPVTTSVWPAVRSREPTCRPSRAAVPVVTATSNVAWPPWQGHHGRHRARRQDRPAGQATAVEHLHHGLGHMPQPRRGGPGQGGGAGSEPGPLCPCRGERQAALAQPDGELGPGGLQQCRAEWLRAEPGQVAVGQYHLLRRSGGVKGPLQHGSAVAQARPGHRDRDERADQHKQRERHAGRGRGAGHRQPRCPGPAHRPATGLLYPVPRRTPVPWLVTAPRRGHADSPARSWAAGSGW